MRDRGERVEQGHQQPVRRLPTEVSRGSATAEFAILLPAFVLVLAVLIGVTQTALAEMKCVDAARTAAREAARHEAPETLMAAAAALAPKGARLHLQTSGRQITVVVSADVSLPALGGLSIPVGAHSVALSEGALSDGALVDGTDGS